MIRIEMRRFWKSLVAICTLLVAGNIAANAQTCNACFTATPDTTSAYVYNVDATCSTPVSFTANFEWIVDGVSWGIYPYAMMQIPFYTAGTHTIDLVFSVNGCSDTASQTISVAPICNASFSSYDAGNGYYYFNAISYFGTGTYTWYFGDGNTAMGYSLAHQYVASGTYNVLCVYEDTASGCLDSSLSTIQVSNVSSGACGLFLNVSAIPGIGLYADASASSYTPGLSQFEFFVNGALVQTGTSTYYYSPTAVGTYTVLVNQLDIAGTICDTDSMVVTTSGSGFGNCYACFYPTYYTSDSVQFDAVCSYISAGGSLAWSVNGAPMTAGPAVWSQVFPAGTHTIALFILDSTGAVCDSTYDYVQIAPPPCTGCISINPVVGSTSDYVFDATCSSVNVSAVAWLVDGQYITYTPSPTFTYSFSQSGTYQVCAQVIDSFGYSCTLACDTVTVNTPPQTSFDIQGAIYKYNSNNWGYYQPVGLAEAKVYLITLQSGGQLDAIDSTTTDAFGMYTFQNKPVDDYRIKAALTPSSPDYMMNVPTYYQIDAMWYGANLITLFTNQYGRDVYLLPGTNTGGPGFISGNVFQGANKKSRGGKATEVTIMLVDVNTNKPVMYAKPAANGDYSFTNVPVGDYKIMGELLNRSSVSESLSITNSNNNYTGKNFMFNDNVVMPTQLTLAVADVKPVRVELSILPNPATNTVNFSTTEKDASITVFDIAGKPVFTTQLDANGAVQVDCSQWASGMYLVELNTAKGKQTSKFNKQ
jgi:hypothetical protein